MNFLKADGIFKTLPYENLNLAKLDLNYDLKLGISFLMRIMKLNKFLVYTKNLFMNFKEEKF
jgi:hypothetical protein